MPLPKFRDHTDWPRVVLLVAAGCAAAGHVGKVALALPDVSADLHLDLNTSALVPSIFTLVAAAGGVALGLSARRFGSLQLVVSGLLLMSVSSVVGALAEDVRLLLTSRVVEGFGMILTAVAAPALIIVETRPEDRRVALGLWGAYIPAGSSLMMLAGAAVLGPAGWRGVWLLAAGLSAACAIAVWIGLRHHETAAHATTVKIKWREAVREAMHRDSLMLAGCFLVYGAQYLAVVSFLPLMLVERTGVTAAMAGLAGAAVAAANIVGNVGSGWLGNRGWPIARVVMWAAVGMALCSIALFADVSPLWLRLAAAGLFTAVGGFIPGTLLGATPRLARTPVAAAGVVGLMIQGAGVGQLLGPPLFVRAVAAGSPAGSWQGAWVFTAAATVALLVMAAAYGRGTVRRAD